MFFRKKKPEPVSETSVEASNSEPGNQRQHYRVRSTKMQPIRASLEREYCAPIEGDCIDLSIGGAGVEFDATHDPKLNLGDLCTLRLRANSRPDAMKATCRVAAVLPLDHGCIRVGFQFINRIELYAQLDEFYARYFNRRLHVRVPWEYDMRTPVRLEWKGGSLTAIAHDISERGLGITMPVEDAQALVKVTAVNVTIRLPKERNDLSCSATIKARTNFASNCLVGLEFSPEGGIEAHLESVRRFIKKRLAAIQAWNASMSKRKAS